MSLKRDQLELLSGLDAILASIERQKDVSLADVFNNLSISANPFDFLLAILQKQVTIDDLIEWLSSVLTVAMPGIETGNSTLSGADAFIFHSGRIYSYNDLISVAVPIEQAGLVEESIEGAVHADEFFKVISKFPSDEIEFEVAEKKWVLKNGKAKAELTLMEFEYQTT